MANVTVQSRVKAEIKEQAEAIFAELGISTSDAIRIFLQQAINTGGLPFPLLVKRPSRETLEAIRELEEGGGKRFKTVDQLFADIDSEP